jgi:phage terminase large subunit-like protein
LNAPVPARKAPPSDPELLERLAALPCEDRNRFMRLLGREEADALHFDWGVWGHGGQRAPLGHWRTWVIMAGRGFGKTRAGAEWVKSVAESCPGAKIALVAATLEEARRLMIEGPSGLLAVAPAEVEMFQIGKQMLRFRNGSEATLFSGASPEGLRGPEHHFTWCDELAKWKRPGETWDMLQLGLRLGDHPRALVTTTPRPGPVLRRIVESRGTVVTGGPTRANPHLPPAFLEAMAEQYAGTRLGRQELEGELLTDVEGALWTVELLERVRVAGPNSSPAGEGLRTFTRTVIGVDPPASTGTCWIVVCARDGKGIAHVIADHSVTGRPPEACARAVAVAAEVHGATWVVAERNQGGEMVRAVLRAADAALPVKLVHASIGKAARAEPVHALFEAGKVRLHGCFPELEAELRGLIAGGGYERVAWPGAGGPGQSPDRAEAMVWALTELMLGARRAEPRVVVF